MSDRKQPQVPQLNLGFGKPGGQKGVMNNMDPRKMQQQYERMQEEEDSEYDDESDGSGEDDLGLM